RMIILHLAAHRPFRQRSLGDIEKSACACLLPIEHFSRLFIQEDICREAPFVMGLLRRTRQFCIAFGVVPVAPYVVNPRGAPLPIPSYPRRINVQPSRAPSKHVLRHRRFRQWLAGEDDRLVGGLQGGAPALPLFRFGGDGHVAIEFMVSALQCFLHPWSISTGNSMSTPNALLIADP